MSDQYKNPNKSKGKDGYKNRRHADAIADQMGGMAGDTVKKIRKRKKLLKDI